jgi:hypothetical protein
MSLSLLEFDIHLTQPSTAFAFLQGKWLDNDELICRYLHYNFCLILYFRAAIKNRQTFLICILMSNVEGQQGILQICDSFSAFQYANKLSLSNQKCQLFIPDLWLILDFLYLQVMLISCWKKYWLKALFIERPIKRPGRYATNDNMISQEHLYAIKITYFTCMIYMTYMIYVIYKYIYMVYGFI